MSDTPSDVIPESYRNLIACHPAKFDSTVEKLAGLVHLLMIESGFQPKTSQTCVNSYSILPDSWVLKCDTLKLKYVTPTQAECTIVVSLIGSTSYIIHGISKEGGNFKSLKLKDIPDKGGRRLKQLSFEFKNQIAYPLFIHIQRDSGGIYPYHFCNLPPEVTNHVLKFLDFKSLSRLSMTCHLLEQLANQPQLWKQLCKR